jgi:hypothetical protein
VFPVLAVIVLCSATRHPRLAAHKERVWSVVPFGFGLIGWGLPGPPWSTPVDIAMMAYGAIAAVRSDPWRSRLSAARRDPRAALASARSRLRRRGVADAAPRSGGVTLVKADPRSN